MRGVQLEQLEQSCVALLRNRVSERSTSMASVRSRGIDPCATLSYAVLTAAWAPKYVIGREQRFELQPAPAMGDRTDVVEVGATQRFRRGKAPASALWGHTGDRWHESLVPVPDCGHPQPETQLVLTRAWDAYHAPAWESFYAGQRQSIAWERWNGGP